MGRVVVNRLSTQALLGAMVALVATAAVVTETAAAAEPVPVEAFAQSASYESIKLSPDGKLLAVTAPSADDQTVIAVIDLDAQGGEFVSVNGFGKGRDIADFWWVGPRRLVASPAERYAGLDYTVPTGELVGFDHDGSGKAYLFGYRGEQQVGSNIQRPEKEPKVARVIAPLLDDPGRAVVTIDDFVGQGRPERATRVALLSTRTGARKIMDTSPVEQPSRLLSDRSGDLLLATTSNESATGNRVHYRAKGSDDWRELDGVTDVTFLSVSTDGRHGFLLASGSNGMRCAWALTLADGAMRELACHDSADLIRLYTARDTGWPVAAIAEPDRPEWVFIDTKHPDTVLLRRFIESFPKDQFIRPVTRSEDGNRMVLLVYSDREPGVYYLFDGKRGAITQIVAQRDAIRPETQARRQPVSLAARDGETLHGYLTRPEGDDPLPLVVKPHGGPLGVRDSWRWDRDSQFLASRGYAVLQVNFRGSAGYGAVFEAAGRREWSGVMIDDIIDATRWAAKREDIDGERIGIYGGSYGGYAAVMAATRAPQLFDAVIGYVGVYDLKRLRRETDYVQTSVGRAFFASSIAGSEDEMTQWSPITHIDKLVAPMLIVHGGKDRRVPVSQAEALRDALRDRDHPHSVYIEPQEGHGFSNPDTVAELLRRVEAFLDEHLAG